jgi:hypothetical protein
MSKHWTREGGSQRRRIPNRRSILIAGSFILLAAVVVITIIFVRANEEVDRVLFDKLPVNIGSTKQSPHPTNVEGRYLFNGTAVLARAVERYAGNDLSQPFSKMNTFAPEQYDAMTLDWECPTTDEVIPYERQIQNLIFNCHTKWLPEVSKHFTIASLANNHSNDLGGAAFEQTQINLNAAGIQTYGSHDPTSSKDACEIVAVPVRVQKSDKSESKAELPVAFCAWHYFFRTPKAGEMEVMERYAKIMPVFGFMHAGAEYYPQAGPDQEAIGRKIIDLGAEFVIGNSPHWVQNSEVYKGKPIFYSTGNFIFDQIDAETMRGMSVDVGMTVRHTSNVAKWLKLGESCKQLHDDCINQAEAAGLKKYDITLTYDVVGSTGGARRVTERANAETQRVIEERVNWAQTKATLTENSGE